MARTVGIGIQDFGKINQNNCFYVDKTAFIKEWWENQDDVTLITRPRRFGKTLAMSMLEHFSKRLEETVLFYWQQTMQILCFARFSCGYVACSEKSRAEWDKTSGITRKCYQ